MFGRKFRDDILPASDDIHPDESFSGVIQEKKNERVDRYISRIVQVSRQMLDKER